MIDCGCVGGGGGGGGPAAETGEVTAGSTRELSIGERSLEFTKGNRPSLAI